MIKLSSKQLKWIDAEMFQDLITLIWLTQKVMEKGEKNKNLLYFDLLSISFWNFAFPPSVQKILNADDRMEIKLSFTGN